MTHTSFGTVAPTSRRAVAYIIDAAIAAGIGIVLTTLLVVFAVMAGPDGMLAVLGAGAIVVWLLMVGWFVVYTIMQSGNGSIGMRAQRLRLVSEADGTPLGFGRTLLRNIIFGLAASIVVGYFTPLFDGSGRFQGWHDKVARSLMMDAGIRPATVGTLPEQDVRVPPRPPLPNSAPNSAPPIPGLATPMAAPQAPAYPTLPAPAAPALDETVRAPEAPRQTPAEPVTHPGTPAADSDSLIAFVPGITQDGPPARETPAPEPVAPAPASPATHAAPAPAPAPATAPDQGESSDIEDTRISIPGHRLVFTWDDGTRVTVSRRTLFGRNPSPEGGAVVVPVRDETLSLSKTHFEAAAEPSGGWIMDRHSTNGTVIMRDGHRITCEPGEQVRVRLGDAIEIGDRIVTVGGYA